MAQTIWTDVKNEIKYYLAFIGIKIGYIITALIYSVSQNNQGALGAFIIGGLLLIGINLTAFSTLLKLNKSRKSLKHCVINLIIIYLCGSLVSGVCVVVILTAAFELIGGPQIVQYLPYIFAVSVSLALLYYHRSYIHSHRAKQQYNELKVVTLTLIGCYTILGEISSSQTLKNYYLAFFPEDYRYLFDLIIFPLISFLFLYIAFLEYKTHQE